MIGFFNIAIPRRLWLALEFVALFVVLPLLVAEMRDRALMIGLLWGGGLGTAFYLWRRGKLGGDYNLAALFPGEGLRRILWRFCLCAPLIAGFAYVTLPEHFLSFPQRAPDRWLMVMLLYPLLSVWPQEVIYRGFMRTRYEALFGTGGGFVAVSALAFGFMHIIFLNAPAVIMSAVLGLIVAWEYRRSQSLGLACVEHGLYGCLAFTVGMGVYFYTGMAWSNG